VLFHQKKTVGRRLAQEDSGQDGARLANPLRVLRLHLSTVRKSEHVEYASTVILNRNDLSVISSVSGLPLDCVTDIAERVVIKGMLVFWTYLFAMNDSICVLYQACIENGSMYHEGGANAIFSDAWTGYDCAEAGCDKRSVEGKCGRCSDHGGSCM
jgi:hypothetical protein